jgi:hypothetical protein
MVSVLGAEGDSILGVIIMRFYIVHIKTEGSFNLIYYGI